MSSTSCQLLRSSTKRSSACTAASARNSNPLNRYSSWFAPFKSQTRVYFATCCGPTPRRGCQGGRRTSEAWVSSSAAMWCLTSWRSTTSTSSAGRIRWSRKATNSSQSDNWWPFSRLPTIAGSLRTLELWWALTIRWCAPSRSWSLLRRKNDALSL